jgi:uncharacterized protein
LPAITVAHPNGGVKEQVAGRYAQRLAEQGCITITADAAYQGSIGGEPRSTDKPYFGTDDIHGMADFITGFAGVDIERLGALGICGGGGYTLKAAQSDKRFKAVATVSIFNSGLVRRNGLQDSQTDTIQEQGYEYYWKTHAHPGSTFRYTMSRLLDLIAFDATDQVELIDIPLLMIAGSSADTRYMSEDALRKATGTADKELFVIEGAEHIETYWVDQYVDAALGRLDTFFGRTL